MLFQISNLMAALFSPHALVSCLIFSYLDGIYFSFLTSKGNWWFTGSALHSVLVLLSTHRAMDVNGTSVDQLRFLLQGELTIGTLMNTTLSEILARILLFLEHSIPVTDDRFISCSRSIP